MILGDDVHSALTPEDGDTVLGVAFGNWYHIFCFYLFWGVDLTLFA